MTHTCRFVFVTCSRHTTMGHRWFNVGPACKPWPSIEIPVDTAPTTSMNHSAHHLWLSDKNRTLALNLRLYFLCGAVWWRIWCRAVTAGRRQTAVTAYLLSKQLLLFAFACRCCSNDLLGGPSWPSPWSGIHCFAVIYKPAGIIFNGHADWVWL